MFHDEGDWWKYRYIKHDIALWFYRRTGLQSPWQIIVRVMPRRLKYWTMIDLGTRHIERNETVPEVPFTEVLQRAWR